MSGVPLSKVRGELFAARVLELTNAERNRLGRPPLKLDESLSSGADWLAEDMALLGYFNHNDSLGRAPSGRAEAFGYKSWRVVAENIAAGHNTPEAVVKGWMNSMKHRQNILDPRYKDMGLGYSTSLSAPKVGIWVQAFGARKPEATDLSSAGVLTLSAASRSEPESQRSP